VVIIHFLTLTVLYSVYPRRKGSFRPEAEAAQFLFWEYINGIFVAVRQPVTTHSCFPFQSSNDDFLLCYPVPPHDLFFCAEMMMMVMILSVTSSQQRSPVACILEVSHLFFTHKKCCRICYWRRIPRSDLFRKTENQNAIKSVTEINLKLFIFHEIGTLHCYKTLRRIPPPWPDGAGVIGQGRGKWFLYMVRKFAVD
jgi:hypothetical protein